MSICINPHCSKPDNSDKVLFCESCGSELLLEGRYRTTKQLGQGGFGKTYEVNDISGNTQRVLKILINNQPKAVELFQREADVLKMLNHPGIPKVGQDDYFIYFPRGSQEPLYCLVMEKIEGMDLYKYMQKRDFRPIKQKLAVEWLKKIVNILQLVHDNNFFHRDIKPPNIMLRVTGDLSLIDFGAAREATQTYYFAQQQGNVTGLISIGYTPYEQMSGQAVPQSDFFALGRTFVFLLTGKEPLDPAIFNSYNDEIHWRDVVPDISPKFADLIDRMMERLPGQRPADTREILQNLAEIEQGVNPSQRSSPQSLNQTSPGFSPQSLNQPFPATVQAAPSTPQENTQSSTLYSANPQPTIERRFWLWWIVAHIAGFASFGILLPITQWLFIRKRVTGVSKTGRWVLVTAIGLILGLFAVSFADSIAFSAPLLAIIFFIIGFAVLGSLQWLLLRRWVSQSEHWIVANTVVGALVGLTASQPSITLFLILIIYPLITGFVLKRLLQHPISNLQKQG